MSARSLRLVLYHEPTLDLTRDVINLLQTPAFAGAGPAQPENGQ